MNTPYGKDVLKQLSEAYGKHDVDMALYYSNPNWHYKNGYNPLSTHQVEPGSEDEPVAAKYPEKVSCMYLDAPVVNFLSCPFGFGKATAELPREEFIATRGIDEIAILSFREHLLDFIPHLTLKNIPIVLLAGDRDTTVPYEENGKLLKDAYDKAGCIIEVYIKSGGDHHPHGLDDVLPIINFIEKYSK